MTKKSGKNGRGKSVKKAPGKPAAAAKAVAGKQEIVLRNYMEDIVKRNMEEQLETRPEVCACPRCRMDMFAYALNHLPAKYVVTDKGHVFTKLQEMEFQFNADVTREVFKAVEFIRAHKRHQ